MPKTTFTRLLTKAPSTFSTDQIEYARNFCLVGVGRMKIDDRSLYRAKQKDMVALLDALQELFQESRDEVTPKQVRERMEQKLHTQVPLHLVVSAYTSLGFVSRKGRKHGEERFIIPNPTLLAEGRAQFLSADISSNKKPKI